MKLHCQLLGYYFTASCCIKQVHFSWICQFVVFSFKCSCILCYQQFPPCQIFILSIFVGAITPNVKIMNCRSTKRTRTSASQRFTTSNLLDKSVVKDNANSFHWKWRTFLQPYDPLALSRFILAAAFIYTSAFVLQSLCSQFHCNHAAIFTLNSICIMMQPP